MRIRREGRRASSPRWATPLVALLRSMENVLRAGYVLERCAGTLVEAGPIPRMVVGVLIRHECFSVMSKTGIDIMPDGGRLTAFSINSTVAAVKTRCPHCVHFNAGRPTKMRCSPRTV